MTDLRPTYPRDGDAPRKIVSLLKQPVRHYFGILVLSVFYVFPVLLVTVLASRAFFALGGAGGPFDEHTTDHLTTLWVAWVVGGAYVVVVLVQLVGYATLRFGPGHIFYDRYVRVSSGRFSLRWGHFVEYADIVELYIHHLRGSAEKSCELRCRAGARYRCVEVDWDGTFEFINEVTRLLKTQPADRCYDAQPPEICEPPPLHERYASLTASIENLLVAEPAIQFAHAGVYPSESSGVRLSILVELVDGHDLTVAEVKTVFGEHVGDFPGDIEVQFGDRI